jgi:hypothetical protein
MESIIDYVPMELCQATLSNSAFSTQDAWRQGRAYSAQEDTADPISSHQVCLVTISIDFRPALAWLGGTGAERAC